MVFQMMLRRNVMRGRKGSKKSIREIGVINCEHEF